MKFRRTTALALATALFAIAGVSTAVATGLDWFKHDSTDSAIRDASSDRHPKNVIFFLGDGMGTQEITAARYYQGVNNKLNVDKLPLTGFDTTWSVKPTVDGANLPDYDPDSASTGTEWATGSKTLDERISQGPSAGISTPGQNLKTILEIAQQQGKKVGDVSTAEITDATPAVLASHISLRGCQGPADMANCATETKAAGGLGSIAEQEVDHKVDVLLGGGRNRFSPTITGGPDAGKTVIQSAQDKGYNYVTDASGLAAYTDKTKPVLGLFTGGNMTTEWTGPAASLGKGNTPASCTETNRPADQPSTVILPGRR